MTCLTTLLTAKENGLPWLAAQPIWPQFYWQPREGQTPLLGLGEIQRCDTPETASRLIKDLPAQGCLLGATRFGLDGCYLFLPRLLWRGNELLLFLNNDVQLALQFLDRLQPVRPLSPLPVAPQNVSHFPEQDQWSRMVTLALKAIQQDEMEKVVLARATDLRFNSPVSAASLLAASQQINHHCYHFLLAFNAEQAFTGSSPERLYRRQQRALSSEALAGTCESATDPDQARQLAEALLRDEKNRRENEMVVEDICQRLQPVANDVVVSPVEVVRLRKVQHLRRRLQCRLLQPDDLLCLQQLQPTVAVAGLPRQPARQFIARHESFSREWYAGSVGYLSATESEFSVALRSAWVTGETVRLYAGAGIVAGSEPALEWREINQKAASLGALVGWKAH
nr:isochorismate synthase [Pantoea sp. BAV 3049]